MGTLRYELNELYGGQFVVNTTLANAQYEPSIAALDNGGFSVSWSTVTAFQNGSPVTQVASRVYDAQGVARTGSEQLVSNTTGFETDPETVAFVGGRSVVHFRVSFGGQGSTNNQILNANGGNQSAFSSVGTDVASLLDN